jgi:hypothetical protein
VSTDVVAEVRAAVSGLSAKRAQVLSDLAAVTADVSAQLDSARGLADAGDDRGTAGAQKLLEQTRQKRRDVLTELAGVDDETVGAVARLLAAGLDPCDAEADVPLLLLPVRLETRFSADGTSLRVRIYPDDVHVDKLDRGLSVAERAAGTGYWTSLWTGGATEDAAWQTLIQAVHRDRASWVASALTPTNLAARPDPPAAAPAPTFPKVKARTLQAPAARALPDRFVVVVSQGGATARATGNPVPREVVVSLPPDSDPAALTAQNGVTLGPGMAWMADFAEAEKIGLALTVQLPSPGAAVDTLLALGVRSSLDPSAGAQELQQLLESHRFADGLAVLPQGTPTNNTETDRAAWTRRPDPMPPPTRANGTPADGSNAAVLAQALGIDPAAFAPIPAADGREQPLGHAASTALWSPSWGSFLDRLLTSRPGGGVDDRQREALRDLFQDWVRGRGTLPALRVGDQPYGLLPVSSVDRRWAPDAGDPLEPNFTGLLRRVRTVWRASSAGVPALERGGALDDTLLEILGLAPQLLGLRVRSIASDSTTVVVPPLLGFGAVDTVLQQSLDNLVWQMLGFGAIGLTGTLGKTTRPLGLPLVDASDPTYINALLGDQPRDMKSVLQALLELALDAEKRAVAAAAPPAHAPQLLDKAAPLAGDLGGRLQELTQATLAGDIRPAELHDTADTLAARFGPAGPRLLTLSEPVATVRTSLAEIALQPALPAETSGQLALQTLGAWFRAQARLAQVRDALGVLAAATDDERRIATAEVLDCASHRLDAWTTALPARRLAAGRAHQATGVLLGAFGWVEGIVPGAERTDGGYMLAPSLTHAATAGILRSAYLTHNPAGAAGDPGGPFAIDLSSKHVRTGLSLLDGVRNGQPVGALLGYRLERRLHESARGLGRFVLSLRALAPLTGGKLTTRAEAPPQQAREAVSAVNVVDGVALLALRDAGTDIRAALGVRPANNPYLDPNRPWEGPTEEEWSDISAALDEIATAHDAAADLLLAEAVHHLVQGNTARGAATLDAAGAGDAIAPDPDVVKIPPRGVAITHRVVQLARDVASGSGGWSTSTPRAVAEPRLAGWAEAQLPPADQIVVQAHADGTRTTLDAVGLAAVDLIHDSATPGLVVRRIRAAVPSLEAGPLAQRRAAEWPAGLVALGEVLPLARSLQRLLAIARPVLPPVFTRPGEQPARAIHPPDLADLRARVTNATTALRGRVDELEALLAAEPPDPAAIAASVEGLAAYGIAIPGAATEELVVAQMVHAEAVRRRDAAQKALAAPPPFTPASGIAVAKILFGDAFWALPAVSAGAPDLFGASFAELAPGQGRIRRFVRDLASVHTSLARYAETLLLGEALGVQRRLRIAQLAPSGTPGGARWLGRTFAPDVPSPDVPVTSVVVDAPPNVGGRDRVAGLLIEEWTEVAPTRIERPDGSGGKVREALVTAGLALNAAAPNAAAPQSILLAVTPDGTRWTTDALVDVLEETLELAKLRTVTLERALWAGRVLPALQEQSWSLQGEETFDLRFLVQERFSVESIPKFVKE